MKELLLKVLEQWKKELSDCEDCGDQSAGDVLRGCIENIEHVLTKGTDPYEEEVGSSTPDR